MAYYQCQHTVFPNLFHFAGTMVGTVIPLHDRFLRGTIDAYRILHVFSFYQIVIVAQAVIAHVKRHTIRIFFHHSHGVWRKVQGDAVCRII